MYIHININTDAYTYTVYIGMDRSLKIKWEKGDWSMHILEDTQ